MTSRLHRRALLQWLAATGLSLPVLVEPVSMLAKRR